MLRRFNNSCFIFDDFFSYREGTLDLNGRAEILLGKFERRYLSEKDGKAGGFFQSPVVGQQIATKIAPYPWRITRGSMVKAARESLRRIGQEKLSIVQTHWSTSKVRVFVFRGFVSLLGRCVNEFLFRNYFALARTPVHPCNIAPHSIYSYDSISFLSINLFKKEHFGKV